MADPEIVVCPRCGGLHEAATTDGVTSAVCPKCLSTGRKLKAGEDPRAAAAEENLKPPRRRKGGVK